MRLKIAVAFMLFVQVLCLFSFTKAQNNDSIPNSYKNLRFWDGEVDNCYVGQDTKNSCVSASIQMVLKYLDFSPLPNQTQLASEMNTDVNSTTEWRFTYIPFKNRGYLEYYNQSLSDNFVEALEYLKGNVSKNFPIIVNTWYNNQTKANGNFTHARVVTGYNSSGVFLHDPCVRPNQFMNYSTFCNLWNTTTEYWAFIVKQEPKFDLFVNIKDWLGNPVPDVNITLRSETNKTETTNINGTVEFSNLTIGNYVLKYDWRLDSLEDEIVLTKPITLSYPVFLSDQTLILVVAIFGLIFIAVMILLKRKKQAQSNFSL